MLKKIIATINKNRKIIISFIILLVIGGGYFFWNQYQINKSEVDEIKTAKVTKGNVSVSFDIDGKTVIKRQDLAFEVGGVIRGINVQEGDEVKPWQTLAYLDVRETQKNLEKALRDYSKERNDFDEDSQVVYKDMVLTDTIKRILEKNQWDLEKAVLDVELDDISKRKSYLLNSFEGIVAQVNYQPGEMVSAQNNPIVITIVDESGFYFESYVEDIEALKVKKDMVVRMTFDALEGEEFIGKVNYVSPLAVIDENELSTYKIIINFEDEDLSLIDGLVGEAEIISKEVVDVVKIPNNAVVREDNKSIVQIKTGTGFEKREIELGFTNGKEVEVISGLKIGDEVAIWK